MIIAKEITRRYFVIYSSLPQQKDSIDTHVLGGGLNTDNPILKSRSHIFRQQNGKQRDGDMIKFRTKSVGSIKKYPQKKIFFRKYIHF